jgi:hypothetical protein
MAQIKVDFITSGNPRESSLFGFWFCLCERACMDGVEAGRGVVPATHGVVPDYLCHFL